MQRPSRPEHLYGDDTHKHTHLRTHAHTWRWFKHLQILILALYRQNKYYVDDNMHYSYRSLASYGHNLHIMSNPTFWEKNQKTVLNYGRLILLPRCLTAQLSWVQTALTVRFYALCVGLIIWSQSLSLDWYNSNSVDNVPKYMYLLKLVLNSWVVSHKKENECTLKRD